MTIWYILTVVLGLIRRVKCINGKSCNALKEKGREHVLVGQKVLVELWQGENSKEGAGREERNYIRDSK